MNFAINGISNDLKKLDKYFSGTAIFTLYNNLYAALSSTAETTASRSHSRLDLYLKDDEPFVVTSAGFPLFIFCSSLLNCYKVPEESA